jgi:hypothetical protein
MSGKGSAQRPKSVDEETFSTNWALVFGTKEEDGQATAQPKDETDGKAD